MTAPSLVTQSRRSDRQESDPSSRKPDGGKPPPWIGNDLAHWVQPPRSRTFLPLLILALLVALAIAALRIDLIRTRYALAEAMKTEERLMEETACADRPQANLARPLGLNRPRPRARLPAG